MYVLGAGASMLSIFDVILVVYGIYTVYSAITMKRTGVPGNWLMGNTDASQYRDIKGFVNYMYLKTVLFGALALVYGIVGCINDYVLNLGIVNIVCVTLFLAGCVVYVAFLNKAKKMFL